MGRRRLSRPLLVAPVGAFVLVLTGGGAVDAVGTASSGTSVTCRAPAGRVAVGVVVVAGDDATPVVRCADVSNTANGFDALRVAGFTTRVEKGFLCAINGTPASGCATGSGFDGSYWRYFRADDKGAWEYATVGAGSRLDRHDGCATEGWVWSGKATITPPSITPAMIGCRHTSTTTVPPTTTTTPVTTSTRPPSTGSGGTVNSGANDGGGTGGSTAGAGGGPGGSSSSQTSPGAAGGGNAVAGVDGSAGSPGHADGNGSPGDEPAAEDGAEQAEADAGVATPPADVSDDTATKSGTDRADASAGSGEMAVATGGRGSDSAGVGGSPLGTLIAGLVIAAVVAGSVVVGRRRSASTTEHP